MSFDATQGSATQNSYSTVAEADAYIEDRGLSSTWLTKTSTEKQQALIKGTDYIERNYGNRWNSGYKASLTQGLTWPRSDCTLPENYGGFDISGTIPEDIKRAAIEAAVLVIEGTDLLPQLEKEVIREKVGSLEIEYKSGALQRTVFQRVSGLLAPYVSFGVTTLIRG